MNAREQWLAERRTGIGGSDVAPLMGLSPWTTPYELWLDKLGRLPQKEETPAMRMGTLLEPLILGMYVQETGIHATKPAEIIRSTQHPFALANLDGLASDRVVEIKSARDDRDWGEPGTDEIPTYYAAQVMHYMGVTGLPRADVAVLIGGSDFRVYTVARDDDLIQAIFRVEQDFWRHVTECSPPPIERASDAALAWPASRASHVQAPPNIAASVARLKEIKAMAKALESEASTLEDIVKPFIADNDTLVDVGGHVLATWKSSKDSSRFDMDAFKVAHPDLVEQFQKIVPGSRRFLIK